MTYKIDNLASAQELKHRAKSQLNPFAGYRLLCHFGTDAWVSPEIDSKDDYRIFLADNGKPPCSQTRKNLKERNINA